MTDIHLLTVIKCLDKILCWPW